MNKELNKPCHLDERSDVKIASLLKGWLTNKRKGLIASSPYSPITSISKVAFTSPSRGMSEAKGEQESTETLSFRCDCERCRLTRGRKNSQANKVAFTLAEVLITLGIIGIVAAMTLPPLITEYKVKELESRFKKVDATLQSALKKSVVEFGYTDVTDLNISGKRINSGWDGQGNNALIGQFKNEVAELNKIWIKQFKGAKKIDYLTLYGKRIWCYDMLGQQLGSPAYSGCFFPGGGGSYILPDGTLVSGLVATWNGYNHPTVIQYVFDTNGPYKGPNRLGYDIFTYVSMRNYRNECNPVRGTSQRLKECYEWASRNQSPIDKTKPYWDILYKPKSYWEK